MRYPQPNNEDAFEDFCLALMRDFWNLPTLVRCGHRGERQHGVDLFDDGGSPVLRAVQCKHRVAWKTLEPGEVREEVAKARTFPLAIGEYVILTTAKKSLQAQLAVRVINVEHNAEGLFLVRLYTWDELEALIDASASAQENLGIGGPRLIRSLVRAELLASPNSPSGDDANSAELDEVKREVERGQIAVAVRLLERLRERSWDSISPGQRARWCRQRADTHVRLGEGDEAARCLIEAMSHQPHDDLAILGEIVANELLGKAEKAHALAVAAVQRLPYSGAAYAGAIRTAASPTELTQLVDQIPDALRMHADVVIATAIRADTLPSERAEGYARRAVEIAPDDARSWWALGAVLLRAELSKGDPENAPAGVLPDKVRVEEAHACFSRVAEMAARRGDDAFRAAALARRSAAASYLGDSVAAYDDTREARRLAPRDPEILVAAAVAEEERKNHKESVQLLRTVVQRRADDEASFFLGMSLWNRNEAGDRIEAVDILARVGLEGEVRAGAANAYAVEGMVVLGRHGRAREHLDQAEPRIEACLVATSRARIEVAEGNAEQASAYLTAALQARSDRTSRSTLRTLAKELTRSGRLADALSVWERLLVPGDANDDVRSFVDCAGRLDLHGKVMAACAALRRAGVFDGFLLQWELRLLDRYDPGAARDVLLQVIEREPGNKQARLHLVHVACRLGEPRLAEAQTAFLPDVSDTDLEDGVATVMALQLVGESVRAIAYAYDLLRRYFGDHRAHRAFRNALLMRDHVEKELVLPAEVGPGVAVAVSEAGGPAQWMVLEDSPVDAPPREDEVRPDSARGRLLLGKKVGDEIVWSDGPAGMRRAAIVKEMLPKYVYRIRDVMDRWQRRFPDHQEMWMVSAAPSSPGGEPDFTPLLEIAKDRERSRREAERSYFSQFIPVWLFGRAIDADEIRAVAAIAGTDGLALRCCVGSSDEYAEASAALKAAAEVVVDLTAVATLLMLGETSVLECLGKSVVVTHSTIEGMRSYVDETRSARSGGTVVASAGEPALVVESEQQRARAREMAEQCLHLIETKCRVVGCPVLADVDPARRKQLEQGLGASTLESLLLGAGSGRVAWTDDGVATQLGRECFGTRRVWTQGVFRWLGEQGLITNERIARVGARLLGWQYMFTSVSPDILRVAGNDAGWNADRWPFRQALWYLALDAVASDDAARLGALLVAHGYLDARALEIRRATAVAVFATLGRRSDAPRTLGVFGRVLRGAFGLNAIGQMDAVSTFEAWRAARPTLL